MWDESGAVLVKKNWNFDYVYEETAVIENKWAKSSTKEARKMGINTKNQERNSKVKDKSQGNVEWKQVKLRKPKHGPLENPKILINNPCGKGGGRRQENVR